MAEIKITRYVENCLKMFRFKWGKAVQEVLEESSDTLHSEL